MNPPTTPGRPVPPQSRWYLLLDGPGDGAWNMAVDESLLDSYATGRRQAPTLRLYGWARPTLSLGATQDASSVRFRSIRMDGVDLVRRPTGGGAVLHEDELTYTVAGPLHCDSFPGGVLDTYRRVSRALVGGMVSLGVRGVSVAAGSPPAGEAAAVCFSRTSSHEIQVESRKLAGSAQLRRGRAFLQHGSVLLYGQARRQIRYLSGSHPPPSLTGLVDILGRSPGPGELEAALTRSFESCFAVRLEEGCLDRRERERAVRLRAWKYLSCRWTVNGQRPRYPGSLSDD